MASEDWVRLHPLSPLASSGRLLLAAFLLGIQSLGDIIGELVSSGPGGLSKIAVGVLAGAVVIFVYSYLAWRMSGYLLTPTRVELRKGIVFRSHRSLPYPRIESVDLVQPFFPRIFGLAEVRVEAVSEGDSELRLRYLGLTDAETLRDELAAARRGGAAEKTGTPATQPATTTLATADMAELLAAYLAPPAIATLPFVVIPLILIVIGEASIVAIAVALPAFFASGLPVFLSAERYWDFTVEDAGDALIIRRGLLNLSSQRIVTGRIQAARIDQPLLWRPFGRFRLVVDVAGYRGSDKSEAAAATLMPIARLAVIVELLRRIEIHADLDALDYRPAPAKAQWRSPFRWRYFRAAWTETYAVCRYGRLWRHTAVVPHAKLQSVRVTQGPWQRRLDLCTVHLDTAGKRVNARARHRDAAEGIELAVYSAARNRAA